MRELPPAYSHPLWRVFFWYMRLGMPRPHGDAEILTWETDPPGGVTARRSGPPAIPAPRPSPPTEAGPALPVDMERLFAAMQLLDRIHGEASRMRDAEAARLRVMIAVLGLIMFSMVSVIAVIAPVLMHHG